MAKSITLQEVETALAPDNTSPSYFLMFAVNRRLKRHPIASQARASVTPAK